MRYQENL